MIRSRSTVPLIVLGVVVGVVSAAMAAWFLVVRGLAGVPEEPTIVTVEAEYPGASEPAGP